MPTEEQLEAQLQATAREAAAHYAALDAALHAERVEARRKYKREYMKRRGAWRRAYTKRPEVMARRREYRRLPEVKEALNRRLKEKRAEKRAANLRTPSPIRLADDRCSSESILRNEGIL